MTKFAMHGFWVLSDTESPQIDEGVTHPLHAIVPTLEMLEADQ